MADLAAPSLRPSDWAWLKKTPAWIRTTVTVATTLGVIYGFGLARGVKGNATAQLPERIGAVELVNARQDARLDTAAVERREIRAVMSRILCYNEAQAGIRHVSECIGR